MIFALASMDLCEQVTALFLGDALHEDAIGATAVEIPFYPHVSLSQSYYALSGYMVFRKDVVVQVVPNLGDPCIGTPLRVWMRLLKVFGTPKVHTILGGPHGWSAARTASFEVLD
jgi:hypothetical protein